VPRIEYSRKRGKEKAIGFEELINAGLDLDLDYCSSVLRTDSKTG
jgi:hypothetical protein